MQLMGLLCPDFPSEMVANAARYTKEGEDSKYEMGAILHHLRFLLYYSEFIEAVTEIFKQVEVSGGKAMLDVAVKEIGKTIASSNLGPSPFMCPNLSVIERNIWPFFEPDYETSPGLSLVDELVTGLCVDSEIEAIFTEAQMEPWSPGRAADSLGAAPHSSPQPVLSALYTTVPSPERSSCSNLTSGGAGSVPTLGNPPKGNSKGSAPALGRRRV